MRRTSPARRAVLVLQLLATLAILAFVESNVQKLVAFAVVWLVTFGRMARGEIVAFVAVSALFSIMDIGALAHGIFRFTQPDIAGMPVWEFFMWGFYVLHLTRLVAGPTPTDRIRLALALAIAFAVPFVTIADPRWCFLASGAMLAAGIACFHEKLDLAYAGYMLAMGMLVEFTGVLSGQWAYPGPSMVPLWSFVMWAGIGLFSRRLLLPMLRGRTRLASSPV